MAQKKPYTPDGMLTSWLRKYIWLRSRERASALKRDKYTCQRCGKKQCTAKGHEVKVEAHHKKGIKWDKIRKYIRRELLGKVENLETLCKECHKNEK